MAISNLVSSGQATERPSVSAFFGQSYKASATQKVSSTMMTDSFVNSTVNMLKGLNSEINRIQTTAKKTLSGFDKIINSIRELNRNITMRFRTLSNELTASRVDFLRGVLNAPETSTPDLGGAPLLVMKNDQTVSAPTPSSEKKDEPNLMDAITTLLGGKAIIDGIKSVVTALVPKLATIEAVAAFFTGSVGSAILGVTSLAGLFLLLAKHRKDAQEADPLGAENFDRSISSGAKRAEIIQGPEADKNAPNPNADISRKRLSPPDFLMKEGVIKLPSEAKNVVSDIKGNVVTLKDGRWFDTTKSDKLESPETHPNNVAKPEVQGPPAPKLTPVQKSQQNRDKARQQQGTPTKEKNTQLGETGDSEDNGLDTGQYDDEAKTIGLPASNRTMDKGSYFKQGQLNRYVTDPRPDLAIGSAADLFYNGQENERKTRYTDYKTNPDSDGKSPIEAGYMYRGFNNMYNKEGYMQTSKKQSDISFTEMQDRMNRPNVEFQKKTELEETGDSRITNTNKFKPARAKMMNDDQVNEFEGFKNSAQKSLSNQMISDVRSPTSSIDRGSADEFAIRAKLEKGERVDPDKPPPTMTKRELASRIEQFGMPALASGAYSPDEYWKITKQADQPQWKSTAQDKAGEWIKNQSAETMAKKSLKPLVPPVVMNNSTTSNSSSNEGGEGNNVAGQNFPLSATNPHIQEFLAKQNVQYQ
jgi:hypothetical protein